jgi:hypothetical protein
MAGLGLGAAGGTAGLNEALQKILVQKFQEQIVKQRLAEEVRQADMARQFHEQQLQQGQQRINLDATKLGEDRRQFDVGAGQAAQRLGYEGQRVGMEQELQPTRLAHMQAQTEDLARQPQEALDTRAFQEHMAGVQGDQRMRQIQAEGAIQRSIAAMRQENAPGPQPQIFYDADNKPHAIQFSGGQAREIGMPTNLVGKAPPRMSAAAAQMVAGADASLHNLDKLEALFPKVRGMIGPAAGRAYTLGQSIPGVRVNPEFATFSAESSTLKNAVIKAITGAQMSEPEAKRIMQQIPLETDKPEVWIPKAKATRDNLAFLRSRLASLYGVDNAGGEPSLPTGGTPAPATDPYAAYLARKKGGG